MDQRVTELSFSARVKELRTKRSLTIADAAKLARISTRSLVELEDVDRINCFKDSQSGRRKRMMGLTVARLTSALGEDPRPWLDEWNALVGIEAQPGRTEEILAQR